MQNTKKKNNSKMHSNLKMQNFFSNILYIMYISLYTLCILLSFIVKFLAIFLSCICPFISNFFHFIHFKYQNLSSIFLKKKPKKYTINNKYRKYNETYYYIKKNNIAY